MYSKKFSRLFLGLCTRTSAEVKRYSPVFVRTAVSHRVLPPNRAIGPAVGQPTIPCHHVSLVRCVKLSRWNRFRGMTACQTVRRASQSTVDPDEVRRFQALASKWWDERGEFAALHSMNDLRVPFIRDVLLSVHRGSRAGKPLAGLRLLDVGCGGGLLTEPLGRLGADILGIDPVVDSIGTADLHASRDPELRGRVSYRACALEELGPGEEGAFDGLVASEVVEHLADLDSFALGCAHVLKPGGSLFITTISRTRLSYALAIVAAERVLGIVPAGTHDWEKFITPVDLERLLESNGFSVEAVRGMLYNPLSGRWSWTQNTSVNYALHAVKRTEDSPAGPAHNAAAAHPEAQSDAQTTTARDESPPAGHS